MRPDSKGWYLINPTVFSDSEKTTGFDTPRTTGHQLIRLMAQPRRSENSFPRKICHSPGSAGKSSR
jgi:hypothetical protein